MCLHNYCAKPHTLWRNRKVTASPRVLNNSVFALSSFYRYRMLRFFACFIPKQQRQLKNAWKRRQNGNPIRGYQRREARLGGGGGMPAVSICQSHHAWASQTALPALLFFLALLAMPCLPSTAAPFVAGGGLQSRVLNALTNFSIHRAFLLQPLWNLAPRLSLSSSRFLFYAHTYVARTCARKMHMYVDIYVSNFICSPSNTRAHTRTDARTHARTHTHAHARTHARARAHTHTHTHTHTLTHTQTKKKKKKRERERERGRVSERERERQRERETKKDRRKKERKN